MARPQVEALSYGHMGSAVDWTLVLNIVFVLLQIHYVLVFSYTPDNGKTAGQVFISLILPVDSRCGDPAGGGSEQLVYIEGNKALLIMPADSVLTKLTNNFTKHYVIKSESFIGSKHNTNSTTQNRQI
jgi:hypothetical protein